MVCKSSKTSHNALRNSHDCHNLGAGSICEVGGGRWGFVDIGGSGVVVQEIESPDFRSPKVRISEMCQPVAEPKAASVIQATHPPTWV